jgi:gamma-glutamyltranspeptidase/glutathione hydrolase
MQAHRPTIMGTRHMVAACHYLVAEAGFRILESGGNAIDAGLAAGIALGVVQPEYVNFAGVAPIHHLIGKRGSAVLHAVHVRSHGAQIPDAALGKVGKLFRDRVRRSRMRLGR